SVLCGHALHYTYSDDISVIPVTRPHPPSVVFAASQHAPGDPRRFRIATNAPSSDASRIRWMPSAAERREALKAVYREARECVRCPLHQTRTQVVFGNGSANADLMFVGEAPGANEDRLGLPFVGQAGKLLDKLLGEIGLERKDVFVANVLKCRPPDNRDTHPNEIASCREYLDRQSELIQPTMICPFGH